MGSSFRNVWNSIMDMLKTPFVGELDFIHLFFLVGVVIIFAAVWAIVLHYVRITSMEA